MPPTPAISGRPPRSFRPDPVFNPVGKEPREIRSVLEGCLKIEHFGVVAGRVHVHVVPYQNQKYPASTEKF